MSISLGDLASSYLRMNTINRLDGELKKVSTELSLGTVADPGAHLNGSTETLSAIDRRLSIMDAYEVAATEAKLLADATETALSSMSSHLDSIELDRLGVLDGSSGVELSVLATTARDALSAMIRDLNTSVGGVTLFGGVQNAGPVTVDSETLIAELEAAVAGLTTADQVGVAISNFFQPGGRFETDIHLGASQSRDDIKISSSDAVAIELRGDSEDFRGALEVLSRLSMLDRFPAARGEDVKLANATQDPLLGAKEDLISALAKNGVQQFAIERASIERSSERQSLQALRLSLVASDQFANATALTEIENRLEIMFNITARTSRLTLVNYL